MLGGLQMEAMPQRIPFLRAGIPSPDQWTPFLAASFEAGQFSNFGPCYQRLRQELVAGHGRDDYDVALCANATIALTATLVAYGLRGKVIVPNFTFPATLHSVLAAGCDVVLADVDPATWELSVETLEKALAAHPDAVAVCPVRVFGFWRDHGALHAAATARGLAMVTDAAAAFGRVERYAVDKVGSDHGHAEVFSFHVTKVFGVGEGGGVFLPRARMAAMESAMNFGFRPDRSFGDGGNAKLDEVHSAIGLARLRTLSGEVATRIRIAARYQRALDFEGVGLPLDPAACEPWQTFPLKLPDTDLRERLVEACEARGIGLRRYYAPALSEGYHGLFADRVFRTATPVAIDLAQTMICLPIYPSLTEREQALVIDVVTETLERHGVFRRRLRSDHAQPAA